jgi:hypothetical protein
MTTLPVKSDQCHSSSMDSSCRGKNYYLATVGYGTFEQGVRLLRTGGGTVGSLPTGEKMLPVGGRLTIDLTFVCNRHEKKNEFVTIAVPMLCCSRFAITEAWSWRLCRSPVHWSFQAVQRHSYETFAVA